MIDLLPYAALGATAAMWLVVFAIARPRLLLYLMFALAPTQFLFIPVSDFHVSPADALTVGAAIAFALRLATLQAAPWRALIQHRFMLLMIGSYFAGFVVNGVFSRTVVRLPMALLMSILACELLRTRRQLLRAATALVVAGAIDAIYGIAVIAREGAVVGGRFSGMSDVNFAAMLIGTSAVISLALIGRTRKPAQLARPGALTGMALSTLSQMGVLALFAAWVTVLRRLVSRANRTRIVAAVVVIGAVALMVTPVRDRIVNRNAPIIQQDGSVRNSAEVRWMIMSLAWTGFSTSPVVGLGYYQFPQFSTRDADIAAWSLGEGYPTHNAYLEVLVEGGLIAFVLLGLHFFRYRRLPSAIRHVVAERDRPVAASLVGLPVMLVCAMFANVLIVYSFWMVCGLALAGLNLLRRETAQLSRDPAGGEAAR